MNLQSFFLLLLVFIYSVPAFCQTQKDTIYAVKSEVPVIIDGSDDDVCWGEMDWLPISQVWIPYAAKMAAGDFEGKYKVAWDADYLYVLVQVVDDMISDDHVNPLQNWWDDDCIEVFIDENRSKGYHEKNNNAFAYHVSTKYDAIDMDSNGNGINYKDNLKVVMDTIGEHTYLWEMAFKIYDATFNVKNPEASRVTLTPKKLMGFTIAYCDNDETTSRENFIGSMVMTSATANDNYITADYFGSLLLSDTPNTTVFRPEKSQGDQLISVFPNPAKKIINLEKLNNNDEEILIELYDCVGVIQKTINTGNRNQAIDLSGVVPGIYFLSVKSGGKRQTEKIILR